MGHPQGRVVRVELSSADLTTAAPVNIYDENGAAVTLEAHERLILREAHLSAANAANTVTLFDDADDDNALDDGERLLHGTVETTGTEGINIQHDFGPEGIACSIGILPHVIAGAAGQVVLTATAYIVNGKTPTERLDWKANDFGQ